MVFEGFAASPGGFWEVEAADSERRSWDDVVRGKEGAISGATSIFWRFAGRELSNVGTGGFEEDWFLLGEAVEEDEEGVEGVGNDGGGKACVKEFCPGIAICCVAQNG